MAKNDTYTDVLTDDMLGDEDDELEYAELGVDYAIPDRDVEANLQGPTVVRFQPNPAKPQSSRPARVRPQRGARQGGVFRSRGGSSAAKVLRGKVDRVQFSKETGVAVITFVDGRTLTIKE